MNGMQVRRREEQVGIIVVFMKAGGGKECVFLHDEHNTTTEKRGTDAVHAASHSPRPKPVKERLAATVSNGRLVQKTQRILLAGRPPQ